MEKQIREEFLPVEKVSQVLNVSRAKAYNLLNDNSLPFFVFGGVRRVAKRDLDEFIKRSKR